MSEEPTQPVEDTPNRGQVLKQLLKQAKNPDVPFNVRAAAVHSIKVELPEDPDVDAVDEAYQEALRAQDDAATFRGYVSALSPKSKSGQATLLKLEASVKKAVKPQKAAAEPREKAPKGPKTPSRVCLCGCGTPCHNNFAPGHDAKVKGLLLKVSRGQAPLSDIPELLRPHLRDFCQRWGLPTDADGNMVVSEPPPPKVKKEANAEPSA